MEKPGSLEGKIPAFSMLQTLQDRSQCQDDKAACQEVKVIGGYEAQAAFQMSDNADDSENGGNNPGNHFWCVGFHNDLILMLKIGFST